MSFRKVTEKKCPLSGRLSCVGTPEANELQLHMLELVLMARVREPKHPLEFG